MSSLRRYLSARSMSWKPAVEDGEINGEPNRFHDTATFSIRHGVTNPPNSDKQCWRINRVYLITEFIIYPKNRSSKPSTTPAGPSLSLPTPSGLLPESITNSNPDSGSNTPATSVEQIKKSYAVKPRGPRADGGVVCCLAVSEYCFKLNRVTVPPVRFGSLLSVSISHILCCLLPIQLCTMK